MRTLVLSLTTYFLLVVSYGQIVRINSDGVLEDQPGYDCNSELNRKEASFFASRFSAEEYDFSGKKAAFFDDRLFLDKREFFEQAKKRNIKMTLRILTKTQKKQTGFDVAIFIHRNKKAPSSAKMNEALKNVRYREIFYKPVPTAREGESLALSDEQANFLNELYNRELSDFDFKNKKIAFIDYPGVLSSKAEFFKRTENAWSHCNFWKVGTPWVLSEIHKAETGYDAVILMGMKHMIVQDIVALLK